MNSMGAFEYRSDKHPLHDRIEELERQNKLMREALEAIPLAEWWEDARQIVNDALAAVGEK